MIIRETDSINRAVVNAIAKLHKKAFPGFFLSQLGIPFLRTLYKGYLEDDNSGIIVAEDESKTVGFIAYSYDYPLFFKGLIRRHIIKFALCSLGAVIRHPTFAKRLLGAFKKSESVVRDEKYVELASICVDPEIRCRGIGTQLVEYLKRAVDFEKYSYINLETDAIGNDNANCFYVKNGFVLRRSFVTAEGRKMNEYYYSPRSVLE